MRVLRSHRRRAPVGESIPVRRRRFVSGAFALAVLGSDGEEAVARATYALASAPTGAVQRYIAAGQRPPAVVDDMVRETYRAVIVGPAANLNTTGSRS